MNVVEWLEDYRKADELIEGKRKEVGQLRRERQRLIDMAEDISPRISGEGGGGGSYKRVENAVISKVLIDEQLAAADRVVEKCVAFKLEVISALEQLPRLHYAVLHRYYIRGMKIAGISCEIHYSERQVSRIKKEGLRLLEEILLRYPKMSLNVSLNP